MRPAVRSTLSFAGAAVTVVASAVIARAICPAGCASCASCVAGVAPAAGALTVVGASVILSRVRRTPQTADPTSGGSER